MDDGNCRDEKRVKGDSTDPQLQRMKVRNN